MHRKTTLASIGIAVALLGILTAGCDRQYRQIVVVDGSSTEFVTWGRGPKKPQKIWVPGRVLIFRTDSEVPDAPKGAKGKAGHVYQLNDQLELEEIGEFQRGMPNDTLAYQFGNDV